MKNLNPIKKFGSILLMALLLLSSCQDDDNNFDNANPDLNIPDNFSEYFGNDVSKDFLGNVVDTNNNPIEGAIISIGNESTTTDVNGVFVLNGATVKERFGYIKAEKPGYIHGSRSVVPSNGTNKVTIMLLEATVTATVNSGNPETVALGNGSSVSLEGNYINEDGTAYTGSVDVIVHHLDPTDEAMPMQMPGMLYAENQNGAERMLQTLGMLAVELRGSNGEDLNLAAGTTSEIRIPLDPSLMSMAPSTIPLWYFDEEKGYWKEEGQATLQGNTYVGMVTHFSFWNCDIPAEAITLCISAFDEAQNPLNNLAISITSATFGTTYGLTNEEGEVCGFVPSNESLELNVYSYENCNDTPLFTETIGPFTTDSTISITIPDNPDVISETVVGQFNTCGGDPVMDGYVLLTYGSQTFTESVSDGTFEINLLRCQDENTFSIKGNDYTNVQSTGQISYTFTTPLTDIGIISACSAVDEFIQFTLDNEETVLILEGIFANFYEDSQGQTGGPSIDVFGFSDNQETCFYMVGVLNEPDYLGTYDDLDFSDQNDTGFFIGECLNIAEANNNIVYNLTSLGTVGEYIDVNFSGSFEDFSGNQRTITGIVHVLRDN